MIRDFKLFCKLKNIKSTELELFNKSIRDFCPDTAACPFCGARGALEHHGSYSRFLIYLEDSDVHTETLAIARFKCACGRTHALLPACLIPYGSYGLLFILTVLRAYLLRLNTITAICQSYRISVSTLYAWVRLFRTHKALWLGILEDLETSPSDFLSMSFGQDDFLRKFFVQMAFSFLQGTSITTASRRSDVFADP